MVVPYLVGCDEGSRSLVINNNGTESNVRELKRPRQFAWNSPPAKTVWGYDCITQDKLRVARHSTSARKKSCESPDIQERMHARYEVHLEAGENGAPSPHVQGF